MNETQWKIEVQGGGDITGAVVKVTCNMRQAVVDGQFQTENCLTDHGNVRIYAANEI